MADVAAVVFDFDGVLANSEPLHLNAYQEALQELGITLGREEYYSQYLGFDDVTALKTIGESRGLNWSEEQLEAILTRKTIVFDDILSSTHVLYPEAAACVERLGAQLPLGIASGALRHEILAILRRSRLDHYFRFIVAAGETTAGKPAPDPYRRAAELHGLPPAQCVAIEDSRWGIESAKRAGLRCVGITQTYPASELPGADRIIDSLDEFTTELIAELSGC